MNTSLSSISSPQAKSSSNDHTTWTIEQRIQKIYTILQQKRSLEEVSRDFNTLGTDFDRVQYMINLEDSKVWEPTLTETVILPVGKSADRSEELRVSGNTSFQQCDYRAAVRLYSQSLAAAPTSSPEHALAQANRSAALFRLLTCSQQAIQHHSHRQHQQQETESFPNWIEDLERAVAGDTQRALESPHYPPHKRYRLWQRLAAVQQRLGEFYASEKSLLFSVMDARKAALTPPIAAALLDDVDENIRRCVLSRIQRLFDSSEESEQTSEKSCHSWKRSERSRSGKLSDEPSNQLPGASSAVKMEWSEEKGRYLVAQRNLKPGDTVILEEPYCWCLAQNCWMTHCHGCGRRVIDFIPCTACSNVVFCTEQCQESSSQRIHRLGCQYLAALQLLDAGNLANLAVEATLKAGRARLQMLRKLNCSNQRKAEELEVDKHVSAFRLLGHSTKRKVSDLFRRTVTAVTLAKVVSNKEPSQSNDSKNELIEMSTGILHYLQSLPCNAHPITELRISPDYLKNPLSHDSQKDVLTPTKLRSSGMGDESDSSSTDNACARMEVVELGAAVYPTVSLMNHSCDPAVLRLTDTRQLQCAVRVMRPVAAGHELLDNYGQHVALHHLHVRRHELQQQYHFTCQCEACCGDWCQNDALPDTAATPLPCSQCRGEGKGVAKKCQCQEASQKLQLSRAVCGRYLQQLERGEPPVSVAPLEEYLTLLDRWTQRPSIEYNRCQEAVKLCYLTEGNVTVNWM